MPFHPHSSSLVMEKQTTKKYGVVLTAKQDRLLARRIRQLGIKKSPQAFIKWALVQVLDVEPPK